MRVIGGVLLVVLIACAGCSNTGEEAWKQVLEKCQRNALTGTDVVYFGPSNAIGPGSIWARAKASVWTKITKGWDTGWKLKSSKKFEPELSNFIEQGQPYSCQGLTNISKSAGFVGSLSSESTPLSADSTADLSSASTVAVAVEQLAEDRLVEAPYEQYVNSGAPNRFSYQQLSKGDRYVMTVGVRITGYRAKVTFNQDVDAAVRARYEGAISQSAVGELGASLRGRWIDSRTLELHAENDIYIAGKLQPYSASGEFASGASHFGPFVEFGRFDRKVLPFEGQR